MKLYIIVGFLGSGKTTLLKRIIELYKNHKIGIVVNDFGAENIDYHLLKDELEEVLSVTNGSIFCSCKSDQFVDKLITLSNRDLDMIFVEGSGLANPNTLIKILPLIETLTDGKIEYAGSLCVVDPTTLHKVISTNLVQNQLIYSDAILINKIDLVNETDLLNCVQMIRDYNPVSTVSFTTYGMIETEHLSFSKRELSDRKGLFNVDLNTQKVTIKMELVSESQLRSFTSQISIFSNRIKGFVTIDNQKYFIEYVNGRLDKKPFDYEIPSNIVVLSVLPNDLEKEVAFVYKKVFQTNIKLIHS